MCLGRHIGVDDDGEGSVIVSATEIVKRIEREAAWLATNVQPFLRVLCHDHGLGTTLWHLAVSAVAPVCKSKQDMADGVFGRYGMARKREWHGMAVSMKRAWRGDFVNGMAWLAV